MVKKKLKHYFLSVSISHKQPNRQQTTKPTSNGAAKQAREGGEPERIG